MNKKIIISLGIIGLAAAIAIGATTAFFSDTETSTGNTFTAGAIDLKIDNRSYVTGEDGILMRSNKTSWQLSDLTGQLFFDFTDLKPGDVGEDTISLHVNNNDAWACMSIDLTGTPEHDVTEPESEVDTTPGAEEGELQDELNFAFWADDGDNVYEVDEVIFAEGLAKDLFDGKNWALADSQTNVWQYSPGTPLTGAIEYYVGKVWCYGNLIETAVPQGENSSPLVRGTGFICDGAPVTNISQTDGIEATVEFYAEQSRNNDNFVCSVCEIEGETGEGWSNTAVNHAFALIAKFGDTDYTGDPWVGSELAVQESKAAGNVVIAEADHEWIDEDWYDFTATYNGYGTHTASITVNGKTASVTDNNIADPSAGEIAIAVKTADTPWNDEGDKVEVKNLMLNGCLINPDNIEAVHPNTGRTLKYIQLSGLDLSGGFTLTGKIMFDWETPQQRFYREAFGMNIDVR